MSDEKKVTIKVMAPKKICIMCSFITVAGGNFLDRILD